MKRKILKVVLLICILLVVLLFDMNYQRNTKDKMVSVLQYSKNFDKDDYIDIEDVKILELPQKNYQGSMILEREFKAGYLIQDVFQDTIVYQSLLTEKKAFKLESDERLITVKCSILESNGWLSKVNDLVDILLISEGITVLIKDASIYKKYDQNLSEDGLPEYYTFIVKEDEAYLFYEHYKMSDVYIVIK